MFWIAGGLGVFFSLFIAVIDKHADLRERVGRSRRDSSACTACTMVPLCVEDRGLDLSTMWRIFLHFDILSEIHSGGVAVTVDLLVQRSRKSTISITKTKGQVRRYRAVDRLTGHDLKNGLCRLGDYTPIVSDSD